MMEWWNSLQPVNQVFFGAAALFSLIFVWQFVSALIGLGHGADIDFGGHEVGGQMDAGAGDMDADAAHEFSDAADSTAAFHILSVRAVVAFFTLFSWAGALYLNEGRQLTNALVLATAWGVGAWVFVALLIHWMKRLAETGTRRLSTCVGQCGTVYLDIPAGGQGEVRIPVSGVISTVKARAAGGGGLKAGAPVRIVRLLDATSVEVRTTDAEPEPKA